MVQFLPEAEDFGVSLNQIYEDSNFLVYNNNGKVAFLDKRVDNVFIDLLTSNWIEMTLPYEPNDKELVWAWQDGIGINRLAGFYDAINRCIFTEEGKRNGYQFQYYAKFDTVVPEWAKKASKFLET